MSESETTTEDGCQRTRDVSLAQSLGRGHAPGLDPHLDQRTLNGDGHVQNLAQFQGLDLDPGKGGKIAHNHNSHLTPPETRCSQNLKTSGDTGLDQAQGSGEKEDHYPRLHRTLQGPVFHLLKTQRDSPMTRKRRRISLKDPSNRKKNRKRINKSCHPVHLLKLKRNTKTLRQMPRPKWQL